MSRKPAKLHVGQEGAKNTKLKLTTNPHAKTQRRKEKQLTQK